MVLRRLGNKSKLAREVYRHFPAHNCYIELFFGAGGVFFKKPQAKYNICNDIDDEVYNLWCVMQTDSDKLKEEIEHLPMHTSLWNDYKNKEVKDKVLKAALFLMYSNFGYLGNPSTLRFTNDANGKKQLLENFDAVFQKIKYVKFMCDDFRNVLNRCTWRSDREKERAFIYADPPYLGTQQYSHKFTEQDTKDLFKMLVDSKMNFAISEFDNDKVLRLADEYKLNTLIIGERQNLKNRRTEILITNYPVHQNLLL